MRHPLRFVLVGCLAVVFGSLTTVALAQSGSPYDLS